MQYKSLYQFCNLPQQTFRITIDYYSILEIPKTADQNQIRIAYVKQASRYHPDSPQKDDIKYSLVREAFAVLGNEKLKFQYDEAIRIANTFKEQPKNEFYNLSDKTDTELEFHFSIGEIKYPMTIKVPTQKNASKERLEELAAYHMRKFIEIDGGFSKRFSGTLFQVNRGLGWVLAILRLIAKKK